MPFKPLPSCSSSSASGTRLRIAHLLGLHGIFRKLFPQPIVWQLENYMSGNCYPSLFISPYFADMKMGGYEARRAVQQHLKSDLQPILWLHNLGDMSAGNRVTNSTFPLSTRVRDFPRKFYIVFPSFTIGHFLQIHKPHSLFDINVGFYNAVVSPCGSMVLSTDEEGHLIVSKTFPNAKKPVYRRLTLKSVDRIGRPLLQFVSSFPSQIIVTLFHRTRGQVFAVRVPDIKASAAPVSAWATDYKAIDLRDVERRDIIAKMPITKKPLIYRVLDIEMLHVMWLDFGPSDRTRDRPREGESFVGGQVLCIFQLRPDMYGDGVVETLRHIMPYPGNNVATLSEDAQWIAAGGSSHLIDIVKLDSQGVFKWTVSIPKDKRCGRLRALCFTKEIAVGGTRVLIVSGNHGIAVHLLNVHSGYPVASGFIDLSAQCTDIECVGPNEFVALSKDRTCLFWFVWSPTGSVDGIKGEGEEIFINLVKHRTLKYKAMKIVKDLNNFVLVIYTRGTQCVWARYA